ncbi:MAG: hypothetical protein LBB16_01885 [Puniceicoccales bacterium]|jgi:hypothetical protein|nr:hypothetical protein [Puniceicoccales bacterium]
MDVVGQQKCHTRRVAIPIDDEYSVGYPIAIPIPWCDTRAGNSTDGGGTPHAAAGNIAAIVTIVVGQFPNVVPSTLDE